MHMTQGTSLSWKGTLTSNTDVSGIQCNPHNLYEGTHYLKNNTCLSKVTFCSQNTQNMSKH